MRMRRIVVFGLSGSKYFSTLSHLLHDFREKVLNMKCVFWLSLGYVSETFLILGRIEQDMLKMYICIHVTYSLFLSDFNETGISTIDFRKIPKHKIS